MCRFYRFYYFSDNTYELIIEKQAIEIEAIYIEGEKNSLKNSFLPVDEPILTP